jgi:hypothetical protein
MKLMSFLNGKFQITASHIQEVQEVCPKVATKKVEKKH